MANEPPSSIYNQKIEPMGSINTDYFPQRLATFLTHGSKSLDQSAPIFNPTKQSPPIFKGWRNPPEKWAEWVDQMAGKHSAVWIKSGILDSIMSSIYETPYNQDLISSLLKFWTPKTNTFVLPWGEVTITLEDVMILGGYSITGESVDGVASMADFGGEIEVMKKLRSELVRSKSKKASHSKWMQMFMTNSNQNEEIEHIGFLSLWLSRFVFPSVDHDSVGKHVIPIAVKLAQGVKLALSPAILAYVYQNLTKSKEHYVDSSSNRCVNLLGPFQLVQIWGYERFSAVGPKSPNELRPGEPRLARWHTLNSNVSSPLLHSRMINPECFIWRPYAVDLQNWKQPSYYQDSEQIFSYSVSLDDDLQSFVCFITPCELNGLGCKAKYHPQRVAMQFGFDQDIPGDVCSYKLSKFVNFLVPSRSFRPGVSKRYCDWWKSVNRMDIQNDQDSMLREGMNASVECRKIAERDCDKKCDIEFVDLSLEDEFDDILVSFKRICNATKKKIDLLRGSYVGVPQSKKKRLKSEFGNRINDVIIID